MFGFQILEDRVYWRNKGETICLEPYGENTIRFRGINANNVIEENWTLLPKKNSDFKIIDQKDKVVIKNGKISVEILENGTINYINANSEYILKEYWIDERELTIKLRDARTYKMVTSDVFEGRVYFKPNDKEHFYGMGSYQHNIFDLKGSTIELCHKNTQSSIPFFYSSLGYGFVWNNPAVGKAELVKNHTMIKAERTKQLDYLIFAGDNPNEIVTNLSKLYGQTPMLPEWAAGFWQCKLRYETQEEVLNIAREHKKRNIPLSVIVIDFFHWTEQGEWKFDPKAFPNPKAMVDELNEMGIKLMVSIWPTVDPKSENYQYMVKNNYIVRSEVGVPVFLMFLGPETYYDATNSEAREYVWNIVKKNYYDFGIKTFWLDEAEPEIKPSDYSNLRYCIGNGLEVTNIYPYYYAKTFYDGMKQQGESDVVNLIRCNWLGSQKYGTVVWSGDIPSTYESMLKQIKIVMSMAMCGMSWWTMDIGGFFGGDANSEEFRELFVRWFQFGAFCPIFRNHGFRLSQINTSDCNSGGPNELWSYGEDNYKILLKYTLIRERLKPYIMKLMKETHEFGTPVVRPLFYEYYKDEETFLIEDQYMFGDSILVAPIYKEKTESRDVYLPKNSKWIYVWNNKEYEGGQYIKVEADISKIPLFVKNTDEGKELRKLIVEE